MLPLRLTAAARSQCSRPSLLTAAPGAEPLEHKIPKEVTCTGLFQKYWERYRRSYRSSHGASGGRLEASAALDATSEVPASDATNRLCIIILGKDVPCNVLGRGRGVSVVIRICTWPAEESPASSGCNTGSTIQQAARAAERHRR